MATITEVVGELSADQAPVLCLDTCDFLDVVRFVAEGNLDHVKSFRRMLGSLDLTPKRFRLLITYLTKHEWEQNWAEVARSAESFLVKTFNDVQRLIDTRFLVGLPLLSIDPVLFDSKLLQELIGLAKSVMDLAIVIEKDDSCVALALERVMEKRRPSHKNEIKDSIHWEHFLELSRQLGTAGHIQSRIFVSANKADFWRKEDNSYQPTIHHDLEVEADAAGLQFFGKLDGALQVLGI